MRIPSLAEVPVLLVCGKKEGEARTVPIRRLGSQASTMVGLEKALRLLTTEATAPDLVRAEVGRVRCGWRRSSLAFEMIG